MSGEKTLPQLFCKPSETDFQFLSSIGNISWVSLDLDTHLNTMHDWVNRDYTTQFWQMSGSLGLLRSCYQCILQNPFAHPFIGYHENKMTAFFDVYNIHADELCHHIEGTPHDCGFHLLMAPNDHPIRDLSKKIVSSFLEYYFSFPEATRIFAEPDITNYRSIRLLERCGFQYLKTIEMSYKQANLFCLEKDDFFRHPPFCHPVRSEAETRDL